MGTAAILQVNLKSLDRTGLVRGVDVLPKGHTRIETGFRYPDGSNVDLFIRREDDLLKGVEPVALTDFGNTLNWLDHLGIDPTKHGRRRKLMDDILQIYDVEEHGAMLHCRVAPEQLGQGIVRLGQACIRIADLAFTARFKPRTQFAEDIEDVLDEASFSYDRETQLVGRDGNLVKVDFRVRGRKQDTALMLLPAETKSPFAAQNRANRVFATFFDLQTWSGQRVAALDDRAEVYNAADISRIENVAAVIPFSDREMLFEVLKAA
jgi:hypothetical protein